MAAGKPIYHGYNMSLLQQKINQRAYEKLSKDIQELRKRVLEEPLLSKLENDAPSDEKMPRILLRSDRIRIGDIRENDFCGIRNFFYSNEAGSFFRHLFEAWRTVYEIRETELFLKEMENKNQLDEDGKINENEKTTLRKNLEK